MKKASARSILVAMMLLAIGLTAQAQQPKKVPRIGYLSAVDPATNSGRAEAMQLALRELGYSAVIRRAVPLSPRQAAPVRGPELD